MRSSQCITRSAGCLPRSKQWWEAALRNEDSVWWKGNLRMSKDTFRYVCTKLRPYITKQVNDNYFYKIIVITVMYALCVLEHYPQSVNIGRGTCGIYSMETCYQC